MTLAVAGQRITPSLLNTNTVQGDVTVTTLTNPTSMTDFTTSWSIPANDALVGTVYILETNIRGVWEANVLNLGWDFSGSKANLVPVNGGLATAGHNYQGNIRLTILITTTGSSGTYTIWASGSLQDSSVNRTSATSVGLNGDSTGKAIDTTVSNTFAVALDFGTSNASQTAISDGSIFTRGGA